MILPITVEPVLKLLAHGFIGYRDMNAILSRDVLRDQSMEYPLRPWSHYVGNDVNGYVL